MIFNHSLYAIWDARCKISLFEGIIDEFTCPCKNVCILTCEQEHEWFLLTHKAELGAFRYHSVNQGPSFIMIERTWYQKTNLAFYNLA